ncbi:lysophospholipid acyltransferase family protein [Zavarzinia compransoris]|uniref:Acyltransferase n=1 Tax=Zavarzinia compransoris TaxID=1264899 RepID=A0A317E1E2_9PROT|nr:lysophospholipid acyltransferase family protein [Zavarzinia compransoris]PWR20779.1 acyltransferase [Zavarzinia compransoris]TDP44386.1 diacylglycerol acyltransferase [Zavarzinia compransoris]
MTEAPAPAEAPAPVSPYGEEDFQRLRRMIGPAVDAWTALTDPLFLGLGNIPAQGPVLLVGNHGMMGTLDAGVMAFGLKRRLGIWPRGLADHIHFAIPRWRDLFRAAGAVEGTPDGFRGLMALKSHVVVYPGGVGEVFKRRGEKYRLRWKQRLGFARLAIEAGCPVVPFSAVGADDSYSVLLGSDEILKIPGAGALARRLKLKSDYLGLYRGLGLTALPRPERYYFSFAPAIDTARFKGEATDDNAWTLRREVEAAIEAGLDDLLARREHDPLRPLRRRLIPLARQVLDRARGRAPAEQDERGRDEEG